MAWQYVVPAITLGFFSSFHCVGMCGPLALALPIRNLAASTQKMAIVLYHFGRLATYSSLGLVFGLFGRKLYIAGFQQQFSIAAGLLVLVMVAMQFIFKKSQPSYLQPFFQAIQKAIQAAWNKTNLFKFLFIGALNGLLPCGMVYFALIATLGLHTPQAGVLFMAAFGAGTLPLMVGLHFLGIKYIGISLRNTMRKAMPVFIASMGVLLIMRGLNLGIPYISPFIGSNTAEQVISCH